MRYLREIIFTIILATIQLQCSALLKNEKHREDALFSLILPPPSARSCWLGGQTFLATGSVTCTEGTATGTGLLTAATDSPSVLSVQLSFKLNEGGELRLYGAGNRAALPTTSAFYSFTPKGSTAYHFDSTTGVDVGYVAGTDTVTYCLEINTVEAPPHLRAANTLCPTTTSSIADATFNSNAVGLPGTAAARGTGWGIQLSSATVQALIPSREEKFAE